MGVSWISSKSQPTLVLHWAFINSCNMFSRRRNLLAYLTVRIRVGTTPQALRMLYQTLRVVPTHLDHEADGHSCYLARPF